MLRVSPTRAVAEYGPPLLLLVAVLVVWQIVGVAYEVESWLLPTPRDILSAAAHRAPLLPQHTWATTYVTLVGYAAAIVVGVVISLIVTYSPFAMRSVYPALLALQSLPKIAIAPILLMWVGFGPSSKIIIVFMMCFFPIVVSMVSGLNSPPQALIDLARSMATPKWRVYLKIRLPYSVPYLFIGLKVAITLAVTGAVVGEFVAAREGLGFLILNGVQQFETPLAFCAIVILALLTVALYGVVAGAEKLLVRWRA
jgi:NitT/TauT family transport system permease protein